MRVTIQKRTVAELMACPEFEDLHQEYADEAAIAGLPPVDEKLAAYRAIEGSGIFQAFGAFVDDKLVGFIAVLLPVIPHYGIAVGVAESFFVAKKHRKSGAGTKLRQMAEQHARLAGSPGLLLSAPTGGRLAEVLPHVGYKETNRVFFRRFADA